MAPTLEDLVTKDLGYCCIYAFFALHRNNAQIAARLGMNVTAVRRYRREFASGLRRCTEVKNCLRGKAF